MGPGFEVLKLEVVDVGEGGFTRGSFSASVMALRASNLRH